MAGKSDAVTIITINITTTAIDKERQFTKSTHVHTKTVKLQRKQQNWEIKRRDDAVIINGNMHQDLNTQGQRGAKQKQN